MRRPKSNPFIFGAKKTGANEIRKLIAQGESAGVIDAAKARNAEHLKYVLSVEVVRKRIAKAEGKNVEWRKNLRAVDKSIRAKTREPKPQKLL